MNIENRWLNRSIIMSLFVALTVAVGCGTDDDEDDDPFGTPIALSRVIASDLTLEPHDEAFPHYHAAEIVRISGATLTIRPGTVISFANDSGLRIDSNAAIIAQGDEDNPVEFIGDDDTEGFWRGIMIQSNNPLNELTHVRIAYAGSSRWFSSIDESALYLNGGQLTLQDSHIESTPQAGIYVANDASWRSFARNTFENLGSAAIITTPGNVGGLDDESDYGEYPVRVLGGNVSDSLNIPNINSYYEMRDIMRVQQGRLTIEPGAELRFQSEAGLRVDSDASIVVQASEDNMVHLIGDTETEGFWRGIMIQSNNPNNELTYVRIAHAGNGRWFSSVDESNLYLNGARLILQDSILEHNPGAGVFIDNNSTWQSFARNTFNELGTAAIITGSENAGGLDSESEYGENPVIVRGSNIDNDSTWASVNSYFLLDDITRVRNGQLTIDPGTVLRFRNDAGIRIDSDASIIIQGTSDEMITFEGETQTPGFWRGIMVSSSNPLNIIEFADFAHTGSSRWFSSFELAAVAVNNGTLTIRNNVFRESTGVAIFATSGADVEESDNEFNDIPVVIQ